MGWLILTVTCGCFVGLSVLFKEVALKPCEAKAVWFARHASDLFDSSTKINCSRVAFHSKQVSKGSCEQCLSQGMGRHLPGLLVSGPPILLIGDCSCFVFISSA